jgi:hypothetical protein
MVLEASCNLSKRFGMLDASELSDAVRTQIQRASRSARGSRSVHGSHQFDSAQRPTATTRYR